MGGTKEHTRPPTKTCASQNGSASCFHARLVEHETGTDRASAYQQIHLTRVYARHLRATSDLRCPLACSRKRSLSIILHHAHTR